MKGVVRITQHQGCWRFEPVDAGKSTRAVYRFHIDIDWSLPAWMGKGQAKSDVAKLFGSVEKQAANYR